MSSLVSQTKIILPSRRPELLTRQRLLDFLTELLDFKLIILAAPAGYGKTSLLIDFIYQSGIPACWYSLDSLDKDPLRFLAHFIASINRRFPEFGERSQGMLKALNQGNLDLDQVVITIVNDLHENVREHFLIVLDDYHLILGSEEIDTFINRFVQETGENCHIALASRTLLPLPDMPLMVARGVVSGLSYEELAFNAAEIQSLAFQNYRMTLPTEMAVEIAQETEGWITGLLLTSHKTWKGDLDQLRAARLSGIDLYDYLAQQVLDQQSPQVRDFLMRTSLLEEFNEELCIAVFGSDKHIPYLFKTVSSNNLFILPVGEDGKWLRYHHLFSDFLQARMARQRSSERDEILSRLAQVYFEWGEYEKSYATYQRLDDHESAGRLVAKIGSMYLTGGRLRTLATWLSDFPEEFIVSHPELNSIRGAVSMMQGNVEEGLYWLRQAEHFQRRSKDNMGLVITLLRISTALRFSGLYEEALERASESLELTAHGEFEYPRAEALRTIGICYYRLGQLNSAAASLTKSFQIYQSLGDMQNVALILMELGITSKIAGRYSEALTYYEQALGIWCETQNLVGQANLLNNLAVLNHLMGEYAKAGEQYQEGLELASQSGYTRMQAYILCGIGDLYLDIGAVDSARDAYAQSGELANRSHEAFLQIYLLLKQAGLARIAQDYEHAHAILENADKLLSSSGSLYEIGLWELEAGHLNAATGESNLARDLYLRAGENLSTSGQKLDAARAYLYLANSYYMVGHRKQAEEYLREVFNLSSKLDSIHFLVPSGCDNSGILDAFLDQVDYHRNIERLNRCIASFQERIPIIRRQLRSHTVAVELVPPALSIHALGISQVYLNGKVVSATEWQSQRRARELFYFIIQHPDGLTKEEVGVVLWPESSSSQLKLQFKNAIYRLRYALGSEVILLKGERYSFNRGLDYIYDVEEFTKSVSMAHANKDRLLRIKMLKKAVSYYQGNYLTDFDSIWLMNERERLWKIFADSVLGLAQLSLEIGDDQSALEYAQKLIGEDPCLEEAHQIAMKAFAARGDRASVFRQFASCRNSLMDEINAMPSQQTNDLFESLIK